MIPAAISNPPMDVGPESPAANAPRDDARSAPAAPPGQPPDIEAVWAEHRRWVAAILLAYKPRWVDLDDLLQEVALAVVRHGRELRDPAAVRPWLRSVAINAARAAARSGNVRQAHLDSLMQASARAAPAGDADAQSGEESSRVLREAMELPEGYREPLILKAVRDLSYRQIGQVLGLPETTVETRIARARRMLRERLGARRDEPVPSGDDRARP